MPTYEYKCEDCQYQFEAFQSIKDLPLSVCPNCGGSVKRLIGVGNGFIFKGSGFYITDYRSKDYKKALEKEKGSSDAATKEAPPEKKKDSSTAKE